MSELLTGPVEVVGTGLLGTSVGLACRRAGLEVLLTRRLRRARAHRLRARRRPAATTRGPPAAGRRRGAARPPRRRDRRGAGRRSDAVVTDVGSVKAEPAPGRGRGAPAAADRYVGGHPMAGSERSGPLAASAALFDGRPVGGHARTTTSDPDAVRAGGGAGRGVCGAVPVRMSPEEHDQAVARTSHLPHLLAVLMAGRLADAPAEPPGAVRAGRPRRDPGGRQRPARCGSRSWPLNADAVRGAARRGPRPSSTRCIDAVTGGDRDALGAAARPRAWPAPARSRASTAARSAPTRSVFVSVPDHPGELARLFADAGASERQHRGRPHRPRPRPPGRPRGAGRRRGPRRAPADVALESRGWVTHR